MEWYFVVRYLAATGARVSELIQIKVEHVFKGYFDLYSKGGKLRRLYIPKKLKIETESWLKEKGVVMIEQPMPKEKLEDIAWITQQSPLPIFADESLQRLGDVAALKGAFTGINIKLMKCTGMREAWKMVTLAHALGMRVMVGCMTETSCAISAASQFSPLVDFADLDGNLLISNDRFKGVEVVKGKITLNDLPGIGVMKI